MNNSFGRKLMKTRLTHGAILCVCGERKCTLSTTTVTHILWNRSNSRAYRNRRIFCPCGQRSCSTEMKWQKRSAVMANATARVHNWISTKLCKITKMYIRVKVFHLTILINGIHGASRECTSNSRHCYHSGGGRGVGGEEMECLHLETIQHNKIISPYRN